jgi:hypothetical protein
LSFSSERLSKFRRLVSWLVSQGAGHCQPYVNPRITLVLGLDGTFVEAGKRQIHLSRSSAS